MTIQWLTLVVSVSLVSLLASLVIRYMPAQTTPIFAFPACAFFGSLLVVGLAFVTIGGLRGFFAALLIVTLAVGVTRMRSHCTRKADKCCLLLAPLLSRSLILGLPFLLVILVLWWLLAWLVHAPQHDSLSNISVGDRRGRRTNLLSQRSHLKKVLMAQRRERKLAAPR